MVLTGISQVKWSLRGLITFENVAIRIIDSEVITEVILVDGRIKGFEDFLASCK